MTRTEMGTGLEEVDERGQSVQRMWFTPTIAELVGVNWEDERVGRDGREEHGQHSARHEAEAEEAEHHGDAIRHARKKERTRLVDAGN
jgi:hypothetical protein